MGFSTISKYKLIEDAYEKVTNDFRSRRRRVEQAEGFIGILVIKPEDHPDQIWLVTHWEEESYYHRWYTKYKAELHEDVPDGLVLLEHSFYHWQSGDTPR